MTTDAGTRTPDDGDRRAAAPTPALPAAMPWRGLAAHAAALVVLLCALAPVVGVHRAVFDADEGGHLLQLDVLDRTGTAFDDYWAHDLDPDGAFVPIQHAVVRDDGRMAPLIQRPSQTLLFHVTHAAGGPWALVAVGCVGVGVAAFATARVAGRLDVGLEVPALWATGLATPLAFDAVVLRGHAIGAAAVAVATLAAVRILGDRANVARLATLGLCATVAGAIRKEAIFVAMGLGAAFAVRWLVERRRELLGVTAIAFVAVPAAIGLDLLIGRVWFGTAAPRSVPSSDTDAGSFVAERVQSLWTATFRPAYEVEGFRPGAIALVAAVVIGAVVLHAARTRRDGTPLVAGLSVVLVLVIARITVLRNAPDLAPGLLVAAPLLLWGTIALPRARYREREVSFLAIAAAVTAAAVVGTQYSMGGAWEWGARYLEVAVPLVLPLAVAGLASLLRAVVPARARAGFALIALVAVTLTGSGLVAQRESRLRVEEQLQTSLALAATTESGVIVSTFPSLPRSAVDQLRDDQRWLWTWYDGLPRLLDALASAGITDAVLVSHQEELSDGALARTDWRRTPSSPLPANPGEWRITTIRLDAPSAP